MSRKIISELKPKIKVFKFKLLLYSIKAYYSLNFHVEQSFHRVICELQIMILKNTTYNLGMSTLLISPNGTTGTTDKF